MYNISPLKLSILFLIMIIIILAIYYYFLYQKFYLLFSAQQQYTPQTSVLPTNLPPIPDIFKNYDYAKIYDPFEKPESRPYRWNIPPAIYPYYFNENTRGYPDTPQVLGLLTNDDEHGDNKILKLFGNPTYPNSTQFDYYTMIYLPNDKIKVKIDRKNELYTGNEIYISEIGKKYKVKLYDVDSIKYNPYSSIYY